MSLVFNRHSIVPFVSGETKAASGQRLAKVGYKSTKQNPAKFPSVAVSVPRLEWSQVEPNMRALMVHIGTMLENAQDGIIRSRYEASGGSLDVVSDADISVLACAAFLVSEAEGDRLTKVTLESWFDSAAAETVFVLMAEKLGFTATDPSPAQSVRIAQSVSAYRGVISSLAGGKTMLEPKVIGNLRTVLDVLDTDEITIRLDARLSAMERKHQELLNMSELL